MIKTMLKMSKAAYVIGLLRIRKNWVKRCALSRFNVRYQTSSWQLETEINIFLT